MRMLAAFALVACGSSSPAGPTPGERVRTEILDVNGHVIVIKGDNFTEWRDVLATSVAFDSQVIAAGPMLFAEANLQTKASGAPILLKGVSSGHTALRGDFKKYVVRGSLDTKLTDAMPIAIGQLLATRLGLEVGDRVDVDLVDRINERPRGVAQVTAVFDTTYPDYGQVLVLTSLEAVQALMGKGDVAMGIEIKLKDLTEATRVAGALGTKLGAGYKVVDWCELNRAVLQCEDSSSPPPAIVIR